MFHHYFWTYGFFYMALLIYCIVWRRVTLPPVNPWPKVEPFRTKQTIPRHACQHDPDCGEGELCFQGECVPTLSSDPTASCHPVTGDWTLVNDGLGNQFLQCVCKYPHLITQKNAASDCVLDIACGPHGRLKDWTQRDACECNEGYTPDSQGQLMCRKKFAYERSQSLPCDPDHESEEVPWPYTKAYRDYHQTVQCHRKPCTFDVVNGRPLTGTFFDPQFGCVCDPRKGYFGVRFDSVDHITDQGYYQGCSSILTHDPVNPLDVRIYAYFYALDKDPVAFIEWSGLDNSLQLHFQPEQSNEPTRWMVGQHWEHHYGQYVLQREEYGVRTRLATKNWLGHYSYDDNVLEVRSDPPILCRDIPYQAKFHVYFWKPNDYELLLKHLVCQIGADEYQAPDLYKGKYVLNPYHVIFPVGSNVIRSNGFVLRWNNMTERWDLDLAPAYREDLLMKRSLNTSSVLKYLNDHPKLKNMIPNRPK